MGLLLENGLPAEGFVFDTALAAYLLDATAGSYDLPRLFLAYCGAELPKPLHLEPEAFSPLGGDTAQAQAAFDAYTAAVEALYEKLPPLLKEQQMWELYETAEPALCRVLAEMERTGFRVDAGELRRFGEAMDGRIRDLEAAIYEMAGGPFNINSPKQLGEVLFERAGSASGQRRPRPATPPTPTCWKSSAGSTPSSTGAGVPPATPSSSPPMWTGC